MTRIALAAALLLSAACVSLAALAPGAVAQRNAPDPMQATLTPTCVPGSIEPGLALQLAPPRVVVGQPVTATLHGTYFGAVVATVLLARPAWNAPCVVRPPKRT